MDTSKLMYLDRLRDEESYNMDHDTTMLDNVDACEYYKKASGLKSEAQLLYEKAKLVEALGFHDWAADLYREANTSIGKMMQYIQSMEEAATETESMHSKSFLVMLLALIAAVVTFLYLFVSGGVD